MPFSVQLVVAVIFRKASKHFKKNKGDGMDFDTLLNESMAYDESVEVASFVIGKAIEMGIEDPSKRDALLQGIQDALSSLDSDSRLALGYVLDQRVFEAHGRGAFSGQIPLVRRLTTVEAHIVHDALIGAGIDARIRREHISAADVLHPTNGVEVWIKPRDLGTARALLERLKQSSETHVKCGSCGENSPGHFAICWNCGASLEKTGEASIDSAPE